MPDENPTSFGLRNSRSINRLRETATETIDLDSLFTSDVTSTGSFDIRGGIWATTFGKVMQVLPIPALLIDGSYNVAVCNQACRKISQDYEKINGQPFTDLFPNRSDSENALSIIKAVFTSRKPRVLESALEIEGSTMWGRMTIRPIRIAQQRLVLTLIEDLTLEKKQRIHDEKLREDLEKLVKERTAELELIAEQLRKEIDRRKRIAEELRKNEASYEALLNATRDLAFLLGSDGTLLAANEQVAKHFRLPSGDLLGRSLFDLAPAGLAGVEETRFNEIIRSANPLRYEAEFFGKVYDNNFYPILDLGGAVIAVAAYIRDITAEKKTNELLMQSARIKAVGDMASGVAHNFNNLLQIVMNAAYDVLADLESNNVSETKAKIKRIIKSAAGGAGTVRRLQDFARARTDEPAVLGKVFDLSSTVDQTVEILRPYWKTNPEKRGRKIFLHRDLSADCLVRGKEDEMVEVVINLIKNAVEALPAGGEIKISTYVDDDSVCLKVQDDGIGIAEANLERIFEPFWSTKGVNGIGMGLASSYGIIRRHKGEIFAESSPDSGTVFTVRMPMEKKSSESRQNSPVHSATLARRVLIIDDSEDSVWVLRNGLTRAGQEVLPALSGREGIAIFENEHVDAVICDLGMPEMNGFQVSKILKQRCLERGVSKPPFILLTGWGGLLDEKEKLSECGVDRVVEKPFLIPSLLEIMHDLLKEPPTS